jgi:hypothetical protein
MPRAAIRLDPSSCRRAPSANRDEAPISANAVLRELNNPAPRLLHAVQRYTDALHVAAEQLLQDPKPSRSSTKPTSTSPDSPPNRLGQPCEPTCSPSRPKLDSTHSATC